MEKQRLTFRNLGLLNRGCCLWLDATSLSWTLSLEHQPKEHRKRSWWQLVHNRVWEKRYIELPKLKVQELYWSVLDWNVRNVFWPLGLSKGWLIQLGSASLKAIQDQVRSYVRRELRTFIRCWHGSSIHYFDGRAVTQTYGQPISLRFTEESIQMELW